MQDSLLSLFASIPTEGGWGIISSKLIEIKNGSELRQAGVSFASFLKQLAAERGKPQSTFWRLVKAGEVYAATRSSLDSQAREFPDLTSEEILATPESIEIVEKIRRAAPKEIANETAYKAMKGLISRSELRDLWETYRPILKHETAYGRLEPSRVFNENDPEMLKAQHRASRIAPVVLSKPDWLGLERYPYSYRVMNLPVRGQFKSSLSAVAALAETPESQITLHGFWIGNDSLPLEPEYKFRYDADIPAIAVDYIWFVSTTPPSPEESYSMPPDVGVVVCGTRVYVGGRANRLKPNVDARAQLLSVFLRESSRVKKPKTNI